MNFASPSRRVSAVPLPQLRGGARFYWWNGVVPLLILLTLFSLWNGLHGDFWLADRLFAWEGGSGWALRHIWLTETLIHQWGRHASTAAWIGVLVACLFTYRRPDLTHWRRPLLYLLAATALSTLLVAWIKSWSNMDCPWDLARYGGSRPYIGLFELRPVGLGRGVCFPAGHAGGGYTWLALYFFLLRVKPQWRWYGLATGLACGLLFGISQQLRGAHFLSHDLAAIVICWASAVVMYAVFWRQGDAVASPSQGTPIPTE